MTFTAGKALALGALLLLVAGAASAAFPPASCSVGSWSSWTACNAVCNGGTRTRHRAVTVGPLNGGSCDKPLIESQVCNSSPCKNTWARAAANQTCTQACKGMSPCDIDSMTAVNTQAKFAYVNSQLNNVAKCNKFVSNKGFGPSYLTGVCDFGTGDVSSTCNSASPFGNRFCCCSTGGCVVDSTPRDCLVGQWGDWSESTCTATCGGGIEVRRRSVTQAPANGGAACQAVVESRPCNSSPCPLDCVVRAWNAWTACSLSCGSGTQTRTPRLKTDVLNGGASCPSEQSQPCNTHVCPVDCQMTQWTAWTACSVTCGGSTQSRSRSVSVEAANGGTACPSDVMETQACGAAACPPSGPGSWVLSGAGKTCAQACAPFGVSCNTAAQNAVKSNTQMAFLAKLMGVTCTPVEDGYYPADPQWFNYKTCYWNKYNISSCTHTEGYPRFCCCSTNVADCPLQ